jgi:glycosyltransferase involved in cell wall biosynthesis
LLKDHNIVYFGPEKWDGMWRNRHQLMSRFARFNRVLYVEPVLFLNKLRHQLQQGDFGRIDFWKAVHRSRIRKISESLHVYSSPAYIPVSGRFPLDKLSWWGWKMLLNRTLHTMGLNRPIIWLSKPDMAHYLGVLNEKLSIYHVVDEYVAYGNMTEETTKNIQSAEKDLLSRVDLSIVVSKQLFESKGTFNEHTYLIPNGVDYEAYENASRSRQPLPFDVADLSRPIIGYSGLISSRLDLNLLMNIAEIHPEWSLVLVGGTNEGWSDSTYEQLQRMRNVHFLGLKDVSRMPYYVKAFDVCVIPYGMNKQAENLSPLKLYDFLAMGKPIVTTHFPAAREFQHVIHIAESKDSFIRLIELSLKENDDVLFTRRKKIASQNTWDHRIYQISEIIQSHLSNSPRKTAKR